MVGPNLVQVLHAFWELDFRSLNHINGVMMVLLHKTTSPSGHKDYWPISLIHSVGKLIAKGLAMRLTPFMPRIVKLNQLAFNRRRQFHDNFRAVQLICR